MPITQPKTKDVKSKIQSFNTNYTNPKFRLKKKMLEGVPEFDSFKSKMKTKV